MVSQDLIDGAQDTGLVPMDMADSDMTVIGVGDGSQVDFGEVDGPD